MRLNEHQRDQLCRIVEGMPNKFGERGPSTSVIVRVITEVEYNAYHYVIRVRTIHDAKGTIRQNMMFSSKFIGEVNRLALECFLHKGIDVRVDIALEQDESIAAAGSPHEYHMQQKELGIDVRFV